MIGRGIGAVIGCVLVGGLAACGDDGSSGDESSFAAEASEICRNADRESVDLGVRVGAAATASAQAVGRIREQLLAITERRNRELAELDPPEALTDGWERFLAGQREFASLQRQLIRAEKANDEPLINRLDARQAEFDDRNHPVLVEGGLDGCDGEIPESDRAEITSLVEATWTTKDPEKICREALTADLAGSLFGSVEECIADQRSQTPAELADRIEVQSLSGTEEISATVQYEVIGGPDDGLVLSDALAYLDGRWVVYRSQVVG